MSVVLPKCSRAISDLPLRQLLPCSRQARLPLRPCCSLTSTHTKPWKTSADKGSPAPANRGQQAPDRRPGNAGRNADQPAVPGRRRQRPGVWLRRCDLGWRPPPWKLHFDVTVQQLGLATTDAAVDAAQNTDVTIDINIATAGGGFYLKGVVNAHVPLRCDRCCCTFTTPVSAKFEIWLNPSGHSDDSLQDPSGAELHFAVSDAVIDISEPIADALELGLPIKSVCGLPDCIVQDAQLNPKTGRSGWSTDNSADTGSNFGVLQQLKRRPHSSAA